MKHKPVILESILLEFSEFLKEKFGLAFPSDKFRDLERGINNVMSILHIADPLECLNTLKSQPLSNEQIEVLTASFTIGETYFFREPNYFHVLKMEILPKIIEAKRLTGKRLRIWSAGCSTGEEAYSIAILLHELISDIQDWNITILATDINSTSLKKLKEGVYGEWSFRGVPDKIKQNYFIKRGSNKFEILPFFKKMITAEYLNLASDSYPSLINNTNAMDLIFCRNILMYFVPSLISKVIDGLYRSLIEQGLLVVGSSDIAFVPRHLFAIHRFSESLFFFFKDDHSLTTTNIYPNDNMIAIELDLDENEAQTFETSYEIEETKEAVEQQKIEIRPPVTKEIESVEAKARLFANQGKLHESLELIEQGLINDKCNSKLHYLKALIYQELGNMDESVTELKKTIYLDPNYILAYFSLGNISANQQDWKVAKKYYTIVLELADKLNNEGAVFDVEEGISIKRMREIIRSNKAILWD